MRPLDPRIRPLLQVARLPLGIALVASALNGVAILGQAFAMGYLVSGLVRGSNAWLPAAWWLAGIMLARAVLNHFVDRCTARAAGKISAHLRRRLMAAALANPGLVGSHRVGSLSALTTRGMSAIEPYLTRYLPTIPLAVILPITVVITMFVLDPWSALIVVCTLPLLPVFAALVGLATRDKAQKQWRVLASLSGHFLDVMRGLPTLVAFGRARRQAQSIRTITDRYRRASWDTLRVAFASSAALELLATLSVALVAVAVGLRLAGGHMELTTALIVILLAPEAYWPIRRMGAEFHAAAEGTATFEQVSEFLADSPTPAATDQRANAFVLHDVDFTYPGREQATLTNITAQISDPGLTAIAGPSGCGKSTLLALLLGEISPTAGSLQRPDHDQIAQAPQTPWLLPGTIADNLRVGDPTASDDALWDALHQVRLAAAIAALPGGLDARLGEDGRGLSAGQKARLSLARIMLAVAAGRRFVVLDEPTAHLDAHTEAVLVSCLRELATQATVIVVAHSDALLDVADTVISLPAASVTAADVITNVAAAPAPNPAAPAQETDLRWGLRTGMLLGTLASACGVALTATAGWLIARSAEHPPVMMLIVAIVGVRTFGIGRPVLRYAERLVSHDAALRLLAERRARVYDALVPLVPARLGVRRGEALTAVVDDVDSEVDDHLRVRLPIVSAAGCVVMVALVGALIDPRTTAVIVGGALLASVPAYLLAHHATRRAQNELVDARATLGQTVEHTLSNARQLVLWQQVSPSLQGVAAASDRVNVAAGIATRGLSWARQWLLAVTALTTVAVGSVLISADVSGPMRALLVLVPIALYDVLAPVADAGATASQVSAARARLQAIDEMTPAVVDPDQPVGVNQAMPVRFDDVSAGWTDVAVLTHLNLDIPPGSRLALTGPSGCGKSTIAATLMRFLNPLAGTMRVGDTNVRECAADDVRRVVGLVDDQPHVFASTLAENVRLAKPDADDDQVAQALTRARLGAWVNALPQGIHTFIGEGHAGVSGGERTRIALARSLLADQQLLVLDEPTAHLDHHTATLITDEVFATDRALVWITHSRLGLDRVDLVISLDHEVETASGLDDDRDDHRAAAVLVGHPTSNDATNDLL